MKTKIVKEVVPTQESYEIEIPTYLCDDCDFESRKEEEVERHAGEKHSYTAQKQVNGDDFYYFDKESGFKAYVKYQYGRGRICIKWHGPAYYRFYVEVGPCGRGCCTDDYIHSESSGQAGRAIVESLESAKERLARFTQAFGYDPSAET